MDSYVFTVSGPKHMMVKIGSGSSPATMINVNWYGLIGSREQTWQCTVRLDMTWRAALLTVGFGACLPLILFHVRMHQ